MGLLIPMSGSARTVIVDATDEVCPVPLDMMIARLSGLQPGDEIVVWATDPAAPIDFESWCLAQGQDYLGEHNTGERIEIRVRFAG